MKTARLALLALLGLATAFGQAPPNRAATTLTEAATGRERFRHGQHRIYCSQANFVRLSEHGHLVALKARVFFETSRVNFRIVDERFVRETEQNRVTQSSYDFS